MGDSSKSTKSKAQKPPPAETPSLKSTKSRKTPLGRKKKGAAEQLDGSNSASSKGKHRDDATWDKLPPEYVEHREMSIKLTSAEAPCFKTRSRIVVETSTDFLALGDLIDSINGTKIVNNRDINTELTTLLDGGEKNLRFGIRRLLPPILLNPMSPEIPQVEEWIEGMDCFKGCLVIMPLFSVGMSIKSVNCRVLVSSVDTGDRSLVKRVLSVGDFILKVADQPVTSREQFRTIFHDELKRKKFVVIVFQRAQDKCTAALKLVREALMYGKADTELNPRMADDIAIICDGELERMKAEEKKSTTPNAAILREEGSAQPHRKYDLKFNETSNERCIGVEPAINPLMLSKVGKKPNGASYESYKEERKRNLGLEAARQEVLKALEAAGAIVLNGKVYWPSKGEYPPGWNAEAAAGLEEEPGGWVARLVVQEGEEAGIAGENVPHESRHGRPLQQVAEVAEEDQAHQGQTRQAVEQAEPSLRARNHRKPFNKLLSFHS